MTSNKYIYVNTIWRVWVCNGNGHWYRRVKLATVSYCTFCTMTTNTLWRSTHSERRTTMLHSNGCSRNNRQTIAWVGKSAWRLQRQSQNRYYIIINEAHNQCFIYCWATNPIADKDVIGNAPMNAQCLTERPYGCSYSILLKARWYYNGSNEPARRMKEQKRRQSQWNYISAVFTRRKWKFWQRPTEEFWEERLSSAISKPCTPLFERWVSRISYR